MSAPEKKRAVLVSIQPPHVSDVEQRENLEELGRLVTTLGFVPVATVNQRRAHPRAGTVVGVGKLRELAALTGGHSEPDLPAVDDDEEDEPVVNAPPAPEGIADVVVVDLELSPSEQRNLEKATGKEVMDRTQVIVEIFHRHAKSREARLQVEIARLTYVAPRLREAGAGRDRQRGGIGGKGAGESALELDRRRIRDRISELKREIESIRTEQATRRAARKDQRRVALVGYTNAGKSSLMRALTGSEVYVADKLFATLDTTVRALVPETQPRILVSDTVGFIKKLPHELVASFRSTLDEALEASLLLYVVDAADPTFRAQLEVTQSVLREIGAEDIPSRLVLNKRDKLSDEDRARVVEEVRRDLGVEPLVISTRSPEDVAHVRAEIIAHFDGEFVDGSLFVPYAEHALVHAVRKEAQILSERHDSDGTHLALRAPKGVLVRLGASLSDSAS
jgi:GTPase